MFGILKIVNLVKPFVYEEFVMYKPNLGHFRKTHIFNTKKIDKYKKKPSCKIPKSQSPECKPNTKLLPCAPRPVDCGYGKKPLPLYHGCTPPNRMDKIPDLRCPHGNYDGPHKKNCLRAMFIGGIMLLISIGYASSIK